MVRKRSDSYLVHPIALFESSLKNNAAFLGEFGREKLVEILKTAPVCCNCMDDAREYCEIEVSGHRITLSGHYMSMRLFPIVLNGELALIVDELYDSEHRIVPRFCVPAETDLLFMHSARFNDDDEMWEQISPGDADC